MPNVSLSIEITSINVAQVTSAPRCDVILRKQKVGSLEFIRSFEPCRYYFDPTPITSDANGIVKLPGLKLIRGPEGVYSYRIKTNNNVTSDTFQAYLGTEVGELKVLTQPIYKAKYGVPLTIQPKVKIVNSGGLPIIGKYCVAMATVDFDIDKDPRSFNIQGIFDLINIANRFALLSGEVSLPSNQNGEAIFTNLTVKIICY